MNKKLVIFDCDGVLIDSELISAEMLIDTLSDFGVSVDLGYVAKNFLGRSYPTVLKQIRAEFDVRLPNEFEVQYRKQLLESFESNLKVTRGLVTVLDRLNVDYCVATSSSPERVSKSLKLVGVYDRFRGRIFTASQVANGKPAPDLFRFTAKEMGVNPEDCLVIEDSLNGIRAALAADMEVWRYTGGSHINEQDKNGSITKEADFAFHDFAEFITLAPELMTSEA